MPLVLFAGLAFIIYGALKIQSIVKLGDLKEPNIELPSYDKQALNDVRQRYDAVSEVNFKNEATGTRDNPFTFYSSYTPPEATEEDAESTDDENSKDSEDEDSESVTGTSQGGPLSEIEDPGDSDELPDLPEDISNITGF